MGAHTANARQDLFSRPARRIRTTSSTGRSISPAASMRELAEETGLTTADVRGRGGLARRAGRSAHRPDQDAARAGAGRRAARNAFLGIIAREAQPELVRYSDRARAGRFRSRDAVIRDRVSESCLEGARRHEYQQIDRSAFASTIRADSAWPTSTAPIPAGSISTRTRPRRSSPQDIGQLAEAAGAALCGRPLGRADHFPGHGCGR